MRVVGDETFGIVTVSDPEIIKTPELDTTMPPSGSVNVVTPAPRRLDEVEGGIQIPAVVMVTVAIGIQPPTSSQYVPMGQHPSKQQNVSNHVRFLERFSEGNKRRTRTTQVMSSV